MSKTGIPRDLIIEALENAGFDEDNIRKGTYGGRYGVNAEAAVTLPRHVAAAMRFAFELGRLCEMADPDLCDNVSDMIDATNSDSMGRDDDIYYWRNTAFTG